MKDEAGSLLMWIGVEVVDPAGVEGAGTSDEAVDLITLLKQQLGHV